MNLYYQLTSGRSLGPLPAYLDMSDADVLRLVLTQVKIGIWRSDLESGHIFCSAEACRVFGVPETTGPINMALASQAIHPEDLAMTLEILETTSREKGAYQLVMRVRNSDADDYRFIRVVGRYRATAHGGGEIIGICHEIPAET